MAKKLYQNTIVPSVIVEILFKGEKSYLLRRVDGLYKGYEYSFLIGDFERRFVEYVKPVEKVKKEGWIISATGKVSEKRFTDNQVYDTEKEAKTRTPDYYLNPSWHKIEWEEEADVPIDDDTI